MGPQAVRGQVRRCDGLPVSVDPSRSVASVGRKHAAISERRHIRHRHRFAGNTAGVRRLSRSVGTGRTDSGIVGTLGLQRWKWLRDACVFLSGTLVCWWVGELLYEYWSVDHYLIEPGIGVVLVSGLFLCLLSAGAFSNRLLRSRDSHSADRATVPRFSPVAASAAILPRHSGRGGGQRPPVADEVSGPSSSRTTK